MALSPVMVSSARAFQTAAQRLVQHLGHGGQSELARSLGISRSYLSDLLAGRKRWPDDMRDKLAVRFGLTVAELLLVGEELVKTGHWFPHVRLVASTMPWSIERAVLIWQQAAREFRLADTTLFVSSALPCWAPRLDDYLEQRISDGEMYEVAVNFLRRLLSAYLPT